MNESEATTINKVITIIMTDEDPEDRLRSDLAYLAYKAHQVLGEGWSDDTVHAEWERAARRTGGN